MKRNRLYRNSALFLFLILQGSFLKVPAQDQVELVAEGPKAVAVGEVFRVSYIVNAKAENFNGPKIENFLFNGPMLSTSLSTQIINGQVTQTAAYTYNYTFQATQEGVFTIPPASVVVKGKTYQSQPLKIEVLKGNNANQQQNNQAAGTGETVGADDLFVRVEVDRTQAYKGEQINATIKIYTRVSLARFGEMKMPSFSGFWSQEIPTPEQISLERTNYNGKLYNMGIIRKTILVPQQSGTIRIEPFELECFVNVQRKRSRSPFDDFFNDGFFGSYETLSKRLASPGVEIRVKPDPPGAPADFNGAVGRLTLTASLDKTQVKTNEAVSYKITAKGNGNLKLIEMPSIRFPADLEVYDPKVTDNFEAGENGIMGSRIFEYLIIPRHAGEFDIPAWSFSYLDPTNGEYKTFSNDIQRITVLKGENDTESTLITTPGREDIRVIGQDIRFIKISKPDIRLKKPLFFGSRAYLFAYIISFLVFALCIVAIWYRFKNLSDQEGVRYRKANALSRKHFQRARNHLAGKNHDSFLEALLKGLWGYLSDKLNMDISALNKDNILETLTAHGIDDETLQALNQLLESAEFLRYAPGNMEGDDQKLLQDAESLVNKIEKSYRR